MKPPHTHIIAVLRRIRSPIALKAKQASQAGVADQHAAGASLAVSINAKRSNFGLYKLQQPPWSDGKNMVRGSSGSPNLIEFKQPRIHPGANWGQMANRGHAADIAANVMRSQGLIFYFDFMLVKEPGTSQKTPWHYDEAYWPVSGNQICNLWISLDHIPEATALRFIPGSHLWQQSYRAVHFDPNLDYANLPDLPQPPDWDEQPGDHEIVYAPMEPGDCLVFNRRCFHSAPGNSLKTTRRRALATHWIGDDITYNDKPQETDPPYRGENLVHGGSMECETFRRVR